VIMAPSNISFRAIARAYLTTPHPDADGLPALLPLDQVAVYVRQRYCCYSWCCTSIGIVLMRPSGMGL
jgi:hypothetical protein